MARATLSVWWDRESFDAARAAYVADLDRGGPPTFVGWLQAALRQHAAEPASARASSASSDGRDGFGRVFVVDDELLLQLDAARLADRRECSRLVSRSQWVREAALAAVERSREAGVLPVSPARLPTGPRPVR